VAILHSVAAASVEVALAEAASEVDIAQDTAQEVTARADIAQDTARVASAQAMDLAINKLQLDIKDPKDFTLINSFCTKSKKFWFSKKMLTEMAVTDTLVDSAEVTVESHLHTAHLQCNMDLLDTPQLVLLELISVMFNKDTKSLSIWSTKHQ
jgi:hypothetical protein